MPKLPITCARAVTLYACLALYLMAGGTARADVVGRLRFHLRNADASGITGATIRLHDTAGVRPDVILTTDKRGEALSPPLENRAWQIQSVTLLSRKAPPKLISLRPGQADVLVTADTSTDLDLALDGKGDLARIEGANSSVNVAQTAIVTRRDQSFIQRFPVTAGNPQNLRAILHTR